MRFTISAKSALVCAAALLAACTNTTTPTNTTTNTAANRAANTATVPIATPTAAAESNVPFPEIKRITTDETNALVAKGEAIIVDVRGDESYQKGHVKGALSITSSDLAARIKELPRDKKIVTYCA